MTTEFSQYDKFVMKHLRVSTESDYRSDEQAAARIKPHYIRAVEEEVNEIPLIPGVEGLNLVFVAVGEKVYADLEGVRAYAMWHKDCDIPKVLTRRGWMTPHELDPTDILLGPKMRIEPITQPSAPEPCQLPTANPQSAQPCEAREIFQDIERYWQERQARRDRFNLACCLLVAAGVVFMVWGK